MKKLLTLMLMLCLMMAFVACSTEEEEATRELNIYSWEGVFPQELLDAFEEETGITVNVSNYDSGETMLSKLEANDASGYDLIIADDYIAEMAIEADLVQKLDIDSLSNYEYINSAYQGQFYDVDDEYTVPHGAGIVSIVYDPSQVDFEITSYSDLWDESLVDSVGIVENSRVVTGVTLISLGYSLNEEDVDAIYEAGEALLELAPNIRVVADSNLQDSLLSGEISAGLMYTSQATLAMLSNPDLEVVLPSEGLGFGIMVEMITKNAENVEEAHEFIDFILEPENAKIAFEYLGYYSTNTGADELIEDEYKSFLTLPADLDVSGLEIAQNISDEAYEAHSLVWTAFVNELN